MKKTVIFMALVSATAVSAAFAADPAPVARPVIAKICTNCHKAEAGVLRGYFDNVAFKSKTIQMKLDDSVELVRFDEDDVKVVNGEGKTGDGELLRKTKKGHEIKLEYSEKNGVKTALKITEKPPVKIPPEMLITTAEVEKLVAMGPEKGKYFLFDSRPLPRFQEGAIPTAVNLPFPAFDKLTDRLPKDKKALVIFYCSGPSCNMSPGSAAKAKLLGYTNLKVYKDGMPAWSEKNFGIVSAQSLKEAWLDKDVPLVLLDTRTAKESEKGFIKGAVSFPASQAAQLAKGIDLKQKKAPVVVYDEKGGTDAETVASELLKAGYGNVRVLTGGFRGWNAAKFTVATGKLAEKISYTPKPRPGEIDLAEFEKYLNQPSANVMIIDVRNADEVKAGMFKSARLIPADEIKDHAAEIPRDKLVITQCSTGIRAEMAYHALKELGYTNIKFVNAKIVFDKNGTYKITKE